MKNRIKTIATVALKNVLPLVVGLGVLVLVIAWLAGVFEKKIAAGQGEVAERTLPEGHGRPTRSTRSSRQRHSRRSAR